MSGVLVVLKVVLNFKICYTDKCIGCIYPVWCVIIKLLCMLSTEVPSYPSPRTLTVTRSGQCLFMVIISLLFIIHLLSVDEFLNHTYQFYLFLKWNSAVLYLWCISSWHCKIYHIAAWNWILISLLYSDAYHKYSIYWAFHLFLGFGNYKNIAVGILGHFPNQCKKDSLKGPWNIHPHSVMSQQWLCCLILIIKQMSF